MLSSQTLGASCLLHRSMAMKSMHAPQEFFDEHVLDNPKVRCTKSKVVELCSLDMKICFHGHLESRICLLTW
jgi:hypothetical protein